MCTHTHTPLSCSHDATYVKTPTLHHFLIPHTAHTPLSHFRGLSSWHTGSTHCIECLRECGHFSILMALLCEENSLGLWQVLSSSYSVLIKDCINAKWVEKDLESHWVWIVFLVHTNLLSPVIPLKAVYIIFLLSNLDRALHKYVANPCLSNCQNPSNM